jgi:hypothetical protein
MHRLNFPDLSDWEERTPHAATVRARMILKKKIVIKVSQENQIARTKCNKIR